MKTTALGLTILLLLRLSVLAADPSDQLAKDIENIASIVAADEKPYVTNYLSMGPGLRGDPLTAAMARNALNKIGGDKRVTLAFARAMYRHAWGTNFPADTRQYGFARLVNAANRDKEVEVMTRSLAEKIINREQDLLNRAAEKFLHGSQRSSTQRRSANFAASQLVGRWRHIDAVRKLATYITFRQDGTYVGSVEENGRVNGSFSGNWTLKDGNLNYEYTASADKHIPAGSKDRDRMLDLTKDHYTIENTLGIRETYVRIDETMHE